MGKGKQKPCRKIQQREGLPQGRVRYSERQRIEMMKEGEEAEISDQWKSQWKMMCGYVSLWICEDVCQILVRFIITCLSIHAQTCKFVCMCSFSHSNCPVRYKLLRCKAHQPLAIATAPTLTAASPPPAEDLHRWLHVYSGTKLFYQDKGLSR